MRPIILSVLATCLATGVTYASNTPSQTGQEDETQPVPSQQSGPDAESHDETKFKLLLMSDGITGSGARWGGHTYETPTHTKVYLYFVYLHSPEDAKKEYDRWLNGALKTISQGTAEDGPATKSATAEERAVIVASSKRDCNEVTVILATTGSTLRVIESCSAEAAAEFEKETKPTKRSDSENDQLVVR